MAGKLTKRFDENNDWIVDSGSTDHIVYKIDSLESSSKSDHGLPIVIPNGNIIPVEAKWACTLINGTKVK